MICVSCYLDRGVRVYDVNGRCDECGGTSFENEIDLDDYIKGERNLTEWVNALTREEIPTDDNID